MPQISLLEQRPSDESKHRKHKQPEFQGFEESKIVELKKSGAVDVVKLATEFIDIEKANYDDRRAYFVASAAFQNKITRAIVSGQISGNQCTQEMQDALRKHGATEAVLKNWTDVFVGIMANVHVILSTL